MAFALCAKLFWLEEAEHLVWLHFWSGLQNWQKNPQIHHILQHSQEREAQKWFLKFASVSETPFRQSSEEGVLPSAVTEDLQEDAGCWLGCEQGNLADGVPLAIPVCQCWGLKQKLLQNTYL